MKADTRYRSMKFSIHYIACIAIVLALPLVLTANAIAVDLTITDNLAMRFETVGTNPYVLDGSYQVETWTDQVNGWNLTNDSAGTRPDLIMSATPTGAAALNFNDAVQDELNTLSSLQNNIAAMNNVNQYTWFAVVQDGGWDHASSEYLFALSTSNFTSSIVGCFATTSTFNTFGRQGSGVGLLASTPVANAADGQWHVITGIWNGSAGTTSGRIDGDTFGTNSGVTCSTAQAGNFKNFALGNHDGATGDAHFGGKLAAFLVYDQAMGTADLESVEQYLYATYTDGEPVETTTTLAFGDSTTAPRTVDGKPLTVYCDLLRAELPDRGVVGPVINAGVGGNTTADAMARFQVDVLNRDPDTVVMQFGINDCRILDGNTTPRVSLANYKSNMTTMTQQLKAAGKKVVLMTPNPLYWSERIHDLWNYSAEEVAASDPVNEYAEAVRQIAAAEEVPLVDIYNLFKQQADYQSLLIDDIHPNDAGHRLVANALLDTLVIPGDANNDGKVDGSDVTILAGNWQAGVGNPNPQAITWGMGDFNHDGQVDGSDVTILAGNWQAGVAAAASAVPEPSLMVLLLTAAITLSVVRRLKV